MTPHSDGTGSRAPEASPSRLLPLGVFAVSLAIYVATLAPSVLPGDSGELIAASHTLSIAHPPGYPLYVMLGKLFASVFALGSVAYRYNLFSAVLGSATAALVFVTMRKLGIGRLIALGVTLALATLEAYWFEATGAEVYALNGLFTALLLYIALDGERLEERTLLILGFVGGLSVSHHLSLVYPLVCAGLIFLATSGIRPRPVTWLLAAFMLFLGLSIWLYVPIRAHVGPPLTWGATDTLRGFISHITAQGYRWRLRAFEPGARARDFLVYFKTLTRMCGIPLVSLACLGVGTSLGRAKLLAGLLLLVGFYGIHYAAYDIPDIEAHIFPASLAVALLAALGLQRLYGLRRLSRPLGVAAIVFGFAVVGLNLSRLQPRGDGWFAYDYAKAIEASARDACGDNCVILSSGDVSLFPLLYVSHVEPSGVRIFDPKISNPAALGIAGRPRTLESAFATLARRSDVSGVALLGLAPPSVTGRPTQISGLVYVVGAVAGGVQSPLAYTLRGVGADLRDYNSRLLAGAYYLFLARWYLAQGDGVEARAWVEKALKASPDDVPTLIQAARLSLAMKLADRALQLARQAVRADPDFFETHDMLAHLSGAAGRSEDAIAEYELALRGNPNPAPVYYNLGYVYLSAGETARARESFEEAIGLDSSLVNAYVGLGRVAETEGNLEQALAQFERARGQAPGSEPALHAEASLLIKLSRSSEARRVIEAGLDSLPQSGLLLSDLGLLDLRQGDLDSAISNLERALAADPSNLAARGNLAMAYEEKGLTEKAIREYRTYLESAPPGPARDKASEALKRLGSD